MVVFVMNLLYLVYENGVNIYSKFPLKLVISNREAAILLSFFTIKKEDHNNCDPLLLLLTISRVNSIFYMPI